MVDLIYNFLIGTIRAYIPNTQVQGNVPQEVLIQDHLHQGLVCWATAHERLFVLLRLLRPLPASDC